MIRQSERDAQVAIAAVRRVAVAAFWYWAAICGFLIWLMSLWFGPASPMLVFPALFAVHLFVVFPGQLSRTCFLLRDRIAEPEPPATSFIFSESPRKALQLAIAGLVLVAAIALAEVFVRVGDEQGVAWTVYLALFSPVYCLASAVAALVPSRRMWVEQLDNGDWRLHDVGSVFIATRFGSSACSLDISGELSGNHPRVDTRAFVNANRTLFDVLGVSNVTVVPLTLA